MFVLNVPESSYILHEVYLTKNELKCIFENQTDELKKGLKLTTKALLETTWTHKSLSVPDQKLLSPNWHLPEPRNDPYWFINKGGRITKCKGCREGLDVFVVGRIELDFFFPKIDKIRKTKCWAVNVDAAYYHPNMVLLRQDV